MKIINFKETNKSEYCKDCSNLLINGWGGGSWCENCQTWK